MKSKNSLLNFLTSYLIYFVLVLFGIYKVRLFLFQLGPELYALNQLYGNLFSYLAIAEGGIGLALIYRLYPKLAEKRYDEINELYSGTKIIFRNIGFLIIAVGFGLTFLIPYILKDNTISPFYITVTFMLFVLRSTLDYFSVMPRLIIQADQKMYRINLMIFGSRFFIILTEILIIRAGYDYVYSLLPGIIFTLVANWLINHHVFKLYPWLHKVDKKDFSTYSDTKHLLMHKGLTLVTKNIDVVLLSFFLGSYSVTIYSAYNYFVKFALDSFEHIFNAIKDAMGIIIQEDNSDEVYERVQEYFSIFDFIALIAITIFALNINKFIGLWIGKAYLADQLTLILFLILVYTSTLRQSYELTKTAMGRFKETKKIATIQAILNVVLSLTFVRFFGIKGVLMGTILSFLLTDFWYYPYYIYVVVSKRKLSDYYASQILNSVVFVLVFLLTDIILDLLYTNQQNLKLIPWMGYGLLSLFFALAIAIPFSMFASNAFDRVIRKTTRALRSLLRHLRKRLFK